MFVQPGITLSEDKVYRDLTDSDIPLKEASMLVNYLYTLLRHTTHQSFVPDTLTRSFHDVVTGLSRLTLFNSYVRIPPLVWKMGWGDEHHGVELPPLPIDILREKDVLQDFVLRVHSIGKFLFCKSFFVAVFHYRAFLLYVIAAILVFQFRRILIEFSFWEHRHDRHIFG